MTPGAAGECLGDGLHIGTVLPQTGALAFFGPAMFTGVDLAVEEINEAGGVVGACVTVTHTDSGDSTTELSRQSAESLLRSGVHAVVGAASSAVSLQFIDLLEATRIVQVSPSNTSVVFTTYPRGDHYFRTAPSDALQGVVLGDLVLQDGHQTVAILAVDDDYGTGLLEATRAAIEAGGGEVVEEVRHDPDASEFSAEAARIAAAEPDAIVLINYSPEFLSVAEFLADADLGPDATGWYLVDGNLADYSDQLPEGFLEGAKGTLPGVDPAQMRDRMLAVEPELERFTYGPESYDAAILIALAAVAAGGYESRDFRDHMAAVSGPGGTRCTGFADCRDLLVAGEEIDYEGASGPVDWDDNGDPTAGFIGVHEFGPDNSFHHLADLPGELGS